MNLSYKMLNLESPAMAERLAYMDFKLYFTGAISRAEIAAAFSVAPVTASLVVSLYRDYRPENIVHDRNPNICILARNAYKPLVEIAPKVGLHQNKGIESIILV